MATTVCDYALPKNVDDGEKKTSMLIPVNQRKLVFDFVLPPGTQRGERAILSFMLHTTGADDLKFHFEIGGHVQSYLINSDVTRVFQEIVGPDVLNVTQLDDNSVTFLPTSGDGVLGISDVVLWFQRAL